MADCIEGLKVYFCGCQIACSRVCLVGNSDLPILTMIDFTETEPHFPIKYNILQNSIIFFRIFTKMRFQVGKHDYEYGALQQRIKLLITDCCRIRANSPHFQSFAN